MSAHIRSIAFDCSYPGCSKRATVEVHNTWNEPMGKYCTPHGDRRVAELRRYEKEAVAR